MAKLDTLMRVGELSFDAARRAGTLALSAVRHLVGPLVGRDPDGATYAPPAPSATPGPPEPPLADMVSPTPTSPPPPSSVAPITGAEDPDHVDREAVVVAESSDPGASGGVGAQIRIDEPWPGYGDLNVRDVNAKLADAGPEMLAIVRLYEGANRNRSTVLDAIDRRLAAISG